MDYVPGKVYLRDRRNGNVYEYEATLAAHSEIESFVGAPLDEAGKVEAAKVAEVQDAVPLTEESKQTGGVVAEVPKPPAKQVAKVAPRKAPAKPTSR